MNFKEKKIWLSEEIKIRGQTTARLLRPMAAFLSARAFPLQILLVITYRLALDYIYITMICSIYPYEGYYFDVRPLFYGASLLAVLVFAPFIAHLQAEGPPSSRIVIFLSYIYFIPLTSYCGCTGASLAFFLTGTVYWTLLLLFQFRLPVLVLSPLSFRHTRQLYMALTALASLFVMFISGRYTGFRFTLDFINVYGIRTEAADYTIPRIFSYALSMMGIILALLLLYWLSRKKYLATAVLIVVYLFLFSIAAHKSLFFFLILLLAAYYLYRPWMLRWIGGLLTLFAGAAVLEEKVAGSFYLLALFFRRSMFLIVRISHQRMELFSKNPLSLFRDSILGKLPAVTPIYATSIPKITGEFRGNIGESANNGLLGDMFANFPTLLGVVLMPLILIVCFRLLDAVSHKLPEKVIVPVCIYFAICFSNTSWSTVLLSGGFLLACLMFYFFPKEEKPLS